MRLKVEPDVVALGPGDVTDLLVRVHNDGEDTCTPHLQVRGVDPDDVLLPDEVVAVPAGSVMTAIVRVRAAADAIPGDRRIAVAVEDLEGSQSTVSATTVLRIGARPDVAVEVDPVATAGRRGAKASTVLRNRSDRRLQIELEGRGDGVLVSFRPSRVTLDPGETKRVRTRMRRARRSWFGEIRHGAVVTARGVGLPASTTATFTQKPSVPRPAVRGVAALTALAVWVAATVVVFNRINAEPEAGPDTGVAAGPAAPGPGRTSATGMFEDDAEEGIRLPVVIQGTVEGPRDPSGTTLTAERIGFGDQGTTTGFTKVVALTEVNLPRGNVLDVVRTTTDERGRFRIASGLVEDAFYRVTAVRAGFEVGSFIVSTSSDQPEVTIAIALEPATGSLAGLVTDTTGAPVGEAEVLVTDGSAEYTAVTPSEGDEAGRWVLEGLATPATYQVVVSRRGFAAQTLIVDLDGGQQRTGVDAVLSADLGTIVGRVVDANPDPDQPGVAQGVGALTVTLAGPEARETRTLTVAGDLRGSFDLPGLPFGDYTVTFSGDGWVTRQAEVTVDRGLVRLDASVNRSTGVVQGWVWQTATGPDAFQGACRYPRVEQRDGGPDSAAADPRPRPCGGVSVSITSDDGDLFATASATDTGFFQIGGVPAGEYTLTLSRPGYVSDVRSIVVQPGGTFRLNPDRTAAVLDVDEAEPFTDFIPLELAAPAPVCIGTVVVNLVDVFAGGAAPDVDASGTDLITVSGAGECEPQPTATRIGTTGAYRIDNVPLGPRTITVGDEDDPAWPYAETDVNVQVSAQDFAAVTASLQPRPRPLTLPVGAIELTGPATASRELRVEVLDTSGTVVAEADTTLTLDGGSANAAAIELGEVTPVLAADYEIRLTGVAPGSSDFSGVRTVTSARFAVPLGTTPFPLPLSSDALPVAAVATTEVTGRVFGFSLTPLQLTALPGATVSEGSTVIATADGDGRFAFVVDSGEIVADKFTIKADGYLNRPFPPTSRTVSAITETLRRVGVGDDFFVLYKDVTGGEPGDVGLDPDVRNVTIPVRLLGAVGAERTLTVTLSDGTVQAPGGPFPTPTPNPTASGPTSVKVLAGGSAGGSFTFNGVRPGRYTVTIEGDDVAMTGTEPVSVIVPVGTGPETLSEINVQATVLVSGTVDEVSTTGSAETTTSDPGVDDGLLPLQGVEVGASAGSVPAGSSESAVTAEDGSFSLVLNSGSSPSLSFVKDGFALANQPIGPIGDLPTQTVGPFTMVRDEDESVRLEGSISDNVTAVVATADSKATQTASITGSGADKRYAFPALDTGTPWTITFTTDDHTVTRFIQSSTATAITMDQDARIENVGTISIHVAVGQDPEEVPNQTRNVRVTLSENVPSAFFSLSATGSVESIIFVSSTDGDINTLMTGTATFENVPVAAASPSLPPDRFTVLVEVLVDVDEAYLWDTDPSEPGTAKKEGFDIAAGESIAANAERSFTFVRAPGPVTSLMATVQKPENDVESGQVRLEWTAPDGRGGAAALTDLVYGVTYSVYGDPAEVTAGCSPVPGATTTCLVTGLLDGTEYEFFVTARNAAIPALAAEAETVSATPRTVPAAPTLETASPTADSVVLNWTKPDDGGSEISGYVIEYLKADDEPTDEEDWDDARKFNVDDGNTLFAAISGLDDEATYQFRIRAVNAAGSGAFSSVASRTTLASDPSGGG